MRTLEINGQIINIAADENDLFAALSKRIELMATDSIKADGLFSFALSGGSTPRGLYSYMAREQTNFPWNGTYLFLGDERCVSHSDGDSNYKMVSDNLLSHISIPSTNVFPTINQDKDPEDSARRYEQTLRRFFKTTGEDQEQQQWPHFSLTLMGLGPDGHTASLFPESEALHETTRLCVANYVAKLDATRLTLTRPVFAHAHKVFFLVAGASKAEIVADVILHPEKGYPSQMVIGDCREGSVEWFVDEPCARLLNKIESGKE
jgi:6-phosphogluconolactonase